MARSAFVLPLVALTGALVPQAALSETATAVVAGPSHACAVTAAGAVLCWGDNRAGQLWDGTATSRSNPETVTGLATGVATVAAGGGHTCAVTTAGAVLCWGSNSSGNWATAPRPTGWRRWL
jgi:alpha-tubulin suppressor-like RCC1 family protein